MLILDHNLTKLNQDKRQSFVEKRVNMKKTPLYEKHLAAGAKMVEFFTWSMPLQYQGIKQESQAVRKTCGMFDVSHMGELFLEGSSSGQFLDYILSRRVSTKKPDLCNYVILCNPEGGAVDDLLVYRLGTDLFMLVVNAANRAKDFAHIEGLLADWQERASGSGEEPQIRLEDRSDAYGLVAVQGPASLGPLKQVLCELYPNLGLGQDLDQLKPFRQVHYPQAENFLIVSRTGYTGEDGYEVYLPARDLVPLWEGLTREGVQPCGLGARDALRLEAGLSLYGHELSDTISPLEAGLEKFVDLDRDFVGRDGLVNHKGTGRTLLALVAEDRAIPRDGYKVFDRGQEVGYVTSGSFSPNLAKGIALALVDPTRLSGADKVELEIRGKLHSFAISKIPFVAKRKT